MNGKIRLEPLAFLKCPVVIGQCADIVAVVAYIKDIVVFKHIGSRVGIEVVFCLVVARFHGNVNQTIFGVSCGGCFLFLALAQSEHECHRDNDCAKFLHYNGVFYLFFFRLLNA